MPPAGTGPGLLVVQEWWGLDDHMVDICWSVNGGWHRPRVQPYGPITLDPAAAVLHYGQEIFEGIKAYRHEDGSIHTFRPDQNGRRLQRSARRLALPELPVEDGAVTGLDEAKLWRDVQQAGEAITIRAGLPDKAKWPLRA